MTTLTLSTPSGKAVTVELGEYVDRPYIHRITVDGQRVGSANASIAPRPAGTPDTTGGVVGRVALDVESTARLQSAIDALSAEIEARPEVKIERLISERESLAREVGYATEDWHESRERAWESGDEARTFGAASDETAIETAKRRLREWDAAHPEVVAEIARRRDESTERYLRTN